MDIQGENPWFYCYRNAGLADILPKDVLRRVNNGESITASNIQPVAYEKDSA